VLENSSTRNSGSAREEIPARYRKLNNAEIHYVFFNKYYKDDQNSINETQWSCSIHIKFGKDNFNGTDHTGNVDTDSE